MPINVQLNDGNFSLGPESGFFYSFSESLNSLVQVESDGTVVDTFPVARAQIRNPVKELHYDGTFFWTLEDLPSNLGITIKRWRLSPFKTVFFPNVTPSEFRWQSQMTLINGPTVRWSADAFAIEHYHREFAGAETQGSSSIELDDVSSINPGDVLYLGPSAFAGFVGNEEEIIVTGVNPSTKRVSFSKGGGLQNSYLASDPVDFVKSIFLFNNNAFSGRDDGNGSLVKFSWPQQNIIFVDSGRKYGGVTAADFDNSILSWVRSTQILQLDINSPTLDLQSSIESNLLEANLIDLIVVYDLIADLNSSLYFKLQQKETTENISSGTFTTDDFTPKFNFQTQTTLPVVNSITLRFPETRFTTPSPAGDSFTVEAQVRDQFNLPTQGETIQFQAAINGDSDPGSPGTFSDPVVVTNTSGIAATTYSPSATPTNILVDITAEVQ